MAPLISRPDPKERAKAWQRLQELEDRALHSGLRRLTSEEVLDLGRLYRRAAADLFAGGVLRGLVTLALLIGNGIMLGVAAVAVARYHTSLEFWGFVAPHGVIELPAIFVAGGAGFMLAYALVNPGEYSRRTALS